jgi:hypothetical protein
MKKNTIGTTASGQDLKTKLLLNKDFQKISDADKLIVCTYLDQFSPIYGVENLEIQANSQGIYLANIEDYVIAIYDENQKDTKYQELLDDSIVDMIAECPESLKSYIDHSKLYRDLEFNSSYATELSYYDGSEDEMEVGAETFYIYHQ